MKDQYVGKVRHSTIPGKCGQVEGHEGRIRIGGGKVFRIMLRKRGVFRKMLGKSRKIGAEHTEVCPLEPEGEEMKAL